jgi:hypothetical protein
MPRVYGEQETQEEESSHVTEEEVPSKEHTTVCSNGAE